MVTTRPPSAPADGPRRARPPPQPARSGPPDPAGTPPRRRPRPGGPPGRALGPPAALAALALAALVTGTAACGDETPGMRAALAGGHRSDGLHGITPARPMTKPALDLTGTDGLPFDLRARTADRVALLYFGRTRCPDVCPATMADLAAALGELAPDVRAHIRVVFVSTDPARDTPAVVSRWLHHFDPGFGFYGLTGPFDRVQAEARALGVDVEEPVTGTGGPLESAHGGEVLAFGRDGRLALRYPPGTQITDYIHDLPVLVAEGAP
ncbi:SCO family protein [Frankia nepalensis]|uniref:SCO family protein n=1 Tax=Frankia nepalensis TaxID=1836974 RepID=UPI00193409F4|nr:SCO family protein [Frankia nepalensis]